MPTRRFPPPWSVEEQPACFVVRDHDGQQLAYIALRLVLQLERVPCLPNAERVPFLDDGGQEIY
jgi:hypothetical protein